MTPADMDGPWPLPGDHSHDAVKMVTGHPPGLLQDDSRDLSRWLASKPGAKSLADEAAERANVGRAALDAGQAQPVAWLCELAQEDGSVKTQIVQEDPDGLRWNDSGEPSPFRVTPLYAAPQAAQPVAPAGWKLVPVEPTPEQRKAAFAWTDAPGSVYSATLSAAPPAPAVRELTDAEIGALVLPGSVRAQGEWSCLLWVARAAIAEWRRVNGGGQV